MKYLLIALALFCAPLMAADVSFNISHPLTRTDAQPIAAADLSFRLECGIADDGTFLDWVQAVSAYNPDPNTGTDTRNYTPPEQRYYWCRAIAIDTVNALEGAASNVFLADFPDPPSPAGIEINIIFTGG